MNTIKIGQHGEQIAAAFLRSKNYKIHECNVRLGRDEIDIIAYDCTERCLVFVEVKTRTMYDPEFPPEMALNHHKKKKMKRAAWKWMYLHEYDAPWRMDAVLIIKSKVYRHIKYV
ncbi:MAG: YraN family protein [Candidatus Peregrinibacteria bacterium]|nr:YraN family protein [Candidatus Peregrinibacteria bacterium]MCB9807868.1 YraN family protein [Candidatus Peribacteria bacterium]